MNFSDLLGIAGVCIILWYYAMLQMGKCNSNDLVFSIVNFIGSALIIVSLFFDWNLSSFLMELAWFLISGYGIFKVLKIRRILNKFSN